MSTEDSESRAEQRGAQGSSQVTSSTPKITRWGYLVLLEGTNLDLVLLIGLVENDLVAIDHISLHLVRQHTLDGVAPVNVSDLLNDASYFLILGALQAAQPIQGHGNGQGRGEGRGRTGQCTIS